MLHKHLHQYAGTWATTEAHLAFLRAVAPLDNVARHLIARAMLEPGARDDSRYAIDADGVAVIEIRGTLTKYGSSFADGPAVVDLRRAVRNATVDQSARSIVLIIDSPGGSSKGIDDLAMDIARAAASKPTYAYIEDVGASAAYWLASQASAIYANAGAAVGGLGVFAVLVDSSKRADMAGLAVHVVKRGDTKGTGTPGSPVTDADLAEIRRDVDAVYSLLVNAVSRGRGVSLPSATAWADGRVHIASEAKGLGLIDGVMPLSDMLATIRGRRDVPAVSAHREDTPMTVQTIPAPVRAIVPPPPDEDKEKKPADEETPVPGDKPAEPAAPAPADPVKKPDEDENEVDKPKLVTVAELKAALPGASADFVLAAIENGLTVSQAKAMQAIAPQRPAPGGPGVPDRRPKAESPDSVGDDSLHPFLQATRARGIENGVVEADARRLVAAENPELYEDWRQSVQTNKPKGKR